MFKLQPELLADLADQLEDRVLQGPSIGAGLLGLVDRPGELGVDDLLGTLQPGGGVEFLIDDLAGAFEGDDFGGGDLERAHALGDRRWGHAEVDRGGGLRVARVEVVAEGVGVDLGSGHRSLTVKAKLSDGRWHERRNASDSGDLRTRYGRALS